MANKDKDKDKDKKAAKAPAKKRGEREDAASKMKKARRVAASCGRPTLEKYIASQPLLRVYYPKDCERLVARTWVPKPKRKPTEPSKPLTQM